MRTVVLIQPSQTPSDADKFIGRPLRENPLPGGPQSRPCAVAQAFPRVANNSRQFKSVCRPLGPNTPNLTGPILDCDCRARRKRDRKRGFVALFHGYFGFQISGARFYRTRFSSVLALLFHHSKK